MDFLFLAVLNSSTFTIPEDVPATRRSLVMFFGRLVFLLLLFSLLVVLYFCLLEASSSCSFSPMWWRWQFLYIGHINTSDHFSKHYSKIWVTGVMIHCCCSFWGYAQGSESRNAATLRQHPWGREPCLSCAPLASARWDLVLCWSSQISGQ